jgi:hypothetical protein
LFEHPHLRSFDIKHAEIRVNGGHGFLEACKHLESLSLKQVLFEGRSVSIPQDVMFERMRRLSLIETLAYWNQVSLAFHCPMLEALEWVTIFFKVRITIHLIQKDYWPVIHHLGTSFCVVNSNEPGDSKWAALLEAISNCFGHITSLGLYRSNFGPKALKAPGFRFSTLVEVDLRN